jgi:hypothetical protein
MTLAWVWVQLWLVSIHLNLKWSLVLRLILRLCIVLSLLLSQLLMMGLIIRLRLNWLLFDHSDDLSALEFSDRILDVIRLHERSLKVVWCYHDWCILYTSLIYLQMWLVNWWIQHTHVLLLAYDPFWHWYFLQDIWCLMILIVHSNHINIIFWQSDFRTGFNELLFHYDDILLLRGMRLRWPINLWWYRSIILSHSLYLANYSHVTWFLVLSHLLHHVIHLQSWFVLSVLKLWVTLFDLLEL